ncbi:hypothetical protein CU097_010137 [Rhizopus azygosporus]|uniref:TMEM62 C-terminal domain-containing protein n=1 Tax=Rhizopus azygosporus TaxID=86630 RepID=A0A367K0U5_RHIAZ|nr:hypothetical protein CU097_010137 [Rhizopus azygosporus]
MVGPWFRAEFIPSAEHPRDRYGTFYMWGMSFGQEWVPIADTWMFAAEQIFFDVFVFFILLVWQGADDRLGGYLLALEIKRARGIGILLWRHLANLGAKCLYLLDDAHWRIFSVWSKWDIEKEEVA